MSQYLTIQETIASIRASFDSEDTRDELFWQNYIGRAESKLAPTTVDIKTTCIPVVDFCFEKPCDFISPVEIALYDAAGNVLRYKLVKGIMKADFKYPIPNGAFGLGYTSQVVGLWYYQIELSEGHFFYNLSTNATSVVKAEIKYYAWPSDDDGNLLILYSDLEYIIAFVHFEEARKKISKSISANGKMTEAAKFMAFHKLEMTKQLGYAKGKRNKISPLEAEYISRAFLTKIQNLSYAGRRN